MSNQTCPRCRILLKTALEGVEGAIGRRRLTKEQQEGLAMAAMILRRFVNGEGCAWTYGSG